MFIMKKTTINRILICIITIMICCICFLIMCIATRPRYISPNEPETAVIAEVPADTNTISQNNTTLDIPEVTIIEETPISQTKQGKTSSKVNIRDAANPEARVLETVEEGYTFEILEILDNGWTKISYNENEAYISSSYVIIIN